MTSLITADRARRLLALAGVDPQTLPRALWCTVLEVTWCLQLGLSFEEAAKIVGSTPEHLGRLVGDLHLRTWS